MFWEAVTKNLLFFFVNKDLVCNHIIKQGGGFQAGHAKGVARQAKRVAATRE